MLLSFTTTRKDLLAAHWNRFRPLLLMSSWAALAAYILMLLCIYPYPIVATELAAVFLKLFLLSNSSMAGMYILFVVAKVIVVKLVARMRSIVVSKTGTGVLFVTEPFPMLSVDTRSLLTEPALCYEENAMQSSFC